MTLMKMVSATWSLIALVLVASPASGESLVEWKLDGRKIGAETGFDIQPGKTHEVRVKLVRPDSAAEITLAKTLPTDHGITEKGQLNADQPQLSFQLGPLTAPAVYEYEAGVVFRKGYRFEFIARPGNTEGSIERLSFYQGLAEKRGFEHFGPGDKSRVVFTKATVRGRFGWEWAVSMASPLNLRLDPQVLADQNRLVVQYAASMAGMPEGMPCVLRVTDADGKEVCQHNVMAEAGPPTKKWPGPKPAWKSVAIDPSEWAPGAYVVDLWPRLADRLWKEGPSVVYHRHELEPNAVPVSPYTPWQLTRDPDRSTLQWNDPRAAHEKYARQPLDTEHWKFEGSGNDTMLIHSGGDETPLLFDPQLEGHYAVFAGVRGNCLLQVGEQGLVREVVEPRVPVTSDVFVTAADLTGQEIRLFGFKNAKSGLRSLRLVPVTADSVAQFYRETGYPPMPLYGVNDWCCYFHDVCRLHPDQFDTLIGAQAELGMRTIDWSIGRSWVEYHTDLPNTTRFPCVPLEEALKRAPVAENYRSRIVMQNEYRPLQEVFAARERFDAEIWPWLSMQRHYGRNAYGGMFASRFYREHPQWWRWPKGSSSPREGAMCYYFPEVRKERVDILLDVAKKGADGLLVGCCRQVPMLLYHEEMVEEYRERTGVDPREIDASQEDAYKDWITWRADFFTQVLRDLKEGLADIEKERGQRIPVAVRIPSAGLFWNLAQGLAVETWCREELVDMLQVEPLDDRHGRGSHDIRPYVELGGHHNVKIVAGIGSTWSRDPAAMVPALKRARGLLAANPDGIEIYETEVLAESTQKRWVLPMFGNEIRIEQTLGQTNLEACYPVDATTAGYGHDNHSFGSGGYDIHGKGARSL